MSDRATWQAVLDPPLVQRLLRPWLRPGRIDPRMAQVILDRYQRPLTPLPLVEQLTQRQHRSVSPSTAPQPIVYAQAAPPASANLPSSALPTPHSPSTGRPTIVQAKFGTATAPTPSSGSLTPLSSPVAPLPVVQPPGERVRSSLPSPPVDQGDLPLVQPAVQPAIQPSPSSISDASPSPTPSRRIVRQVHFDRGRNEGRSSPPLPNDFPNDFPNALDDRGDRAFTPQPPAVTASTSSPSSDPPPLTWVQSPPSRGSATATSSREPSPDKPVVQVGSTQARGDRSKPFLPELAPLESSPMPVVQWRSPGWKIHPRATKAQPSIAARPTLESRIPSEPTRTSEPTGTLDSPSLPLVQVSQPRGEGGQSPGQTVVAQPLVFSTAASVNRGANPNGAFPMGLGRSESPRSELSSPRARPDYSPSSQPTQSLPTVSAHPVKVPDNPSPQEPRVDLEALADKVERKLMRRLVVERERRGR